MSKNLVAIIADDESLDCFGDFNKHNQLCAKHCVLRLRCAIEQDQNLRSAILDQLVAYDSPLGKMQ
jgi:hypothetical protein